MAGHYTVVYVRRHRINFSKGMSAFDEYSASARTLASLAAGAKANT